MEILGILLYLIIKYVFYFGWCVSANKSLTINLNRYWLAFYAFIRLLIGVLLGSIFGVAIYYLALKPLEEMIYPILFLIILRWFEWSTLEVLMRKESRSLKNFLVGSTAKIIYLRIFGIFISFAADITTAILAFIFAMNFGGRIFC